MPFDLSLPRSLARAGWKVKIRDKEMRVSGGTKCIRTILSGEKGNRP